MRPLYRHRYYRPLGNVEVVPFPGKCTVPTVPDINQDSQPLFPSGAGFFWWDAESAQFLDRSRAASAHLDTAFAKYVERGDSLRNSHRMVVWERQQHDGMPDSDLRCPLAKRAIQHLGRGTVREPGLKMMLDTPEVAEANLLCQSYLFQHLVKDLCLAFAILQRAANLNLVKDSEVHDALLWPDAGPGRPSLLSNYGAFLDSSPARTAAR